MHYFQSAWQPVDDFSMGSWNPPTAVEVQLIRAARKRSLERLKEARKRLLTSSV